LLKVEHLGGCSLSLSLGEELRLESFQKPSAVSFTPKADSERREKVDHALSDAAVPLPLKVKTTQAHSGK
jgi:hypothetical protein